MSEGDLSMGHLVPDELRQMTRYDLPDLSGAKVFLHANESPWPIDPALAAGLAEALAKVELHRYPDGEALALHRALAASVGVEPARIVVGNGSDELIWMLLCAFRRPRAPAHRAATLYPWPSFAYYRIAATALGIDRVEVPLDARFELKADVLEEMWRRACPNVAFFALPNNPTGTLWDQALVLRMAERFPDTIVVADEAYVDYSEKSLVGALKDHPNLVILRTLSKLGLAALRVGFLIGPPAIVDALERIRPPYNVGALNQAAAAFLVGQQHGKLVARAREVVAERGRLAGELSKRRGLEVFPSQANHLLVRVDTPGDGAAAKLQLALMGKGVVVRSFDKPGPLAGCLRVTVGTPAEDDALLAALDAIRPR